MEKVICWRASILSFAVLSFLVTGRIVVAACIGVTELLIGSCRQYLRVWNKTDLGRVHAIEDYPLELDYLDIGEPCASEGVVSANRTLPMRVDKQALVELGSTKTAH